jgi:hypothetical protein
LIKVGLILIIIAFAHYNKVPPVDAKYLSSSHKAPISIGKEVSLYGSNERSLSGSKEE